MDDVLPLILSLADANSPRFRAFTLPDAGQKMDAADDEFIKRTGGEDT